MAILVNISLLGPKNYKNALYHLIKIPNLHFTDGHFHPKLLGNSMIRNMKEILTKSIILYAHLGPPVILVKHLIIIYLKKFRKAIFCMILIISMQYFFLESIEQVFLTNYIYRLEYHRYYF